MKSWLSALHTAWSAAIAAAQYNCTCTSTETIHTYANRYEQITTGHHVAHHGLCRLYLSSSRNKSKPDAACILYYVEQTGS